jgi:hypothetical protein
MKKFVLVLFVALVATHVAASDERTIAVSESVLADLPRVSVKAEPHHGVGAGMYEGVTLTSLLTKSGVPSGEAIRGEKLTLVVIAKAADGYAAAFALAELDPAFSKKLFLLADKKDGKPLRNRKGHSV